MKKRLIALMCLAAVAGTLLAGCGEPQPAEIQTTEDNVAQTEEQQETTDGAEPYVAELEDGVYLVKFDTDSSMFHVNEASEGMGTLTVQDGAMTVHISLVSKNIVNLYCGLAEDAEANEGDWLQPTTDSVTYSDGMTEEVYGFDVPVPTLDEEFDLAILGTKGTWYDHKVSISDPVLQ